MPFSIRVAVLLISIFFNLLFVVTHGFLSNQGRKVRRNIYISVKSISTTATINTDSSNEESSDTAMTPFERLSRAVSFYSAAVPVFASYKILEQKFKLNPTDVESEEKEYQKIHEWGSEIMTEKIKELRGFYVKTGQIISTRVDIFPEQYTSKLAVTLDALDPVPAESIKEIVRNELLGGGDLSELFLEFEDEPLGSASIAQVSIYQWYSN